MEDTERFNRLRLIRSANIGPVSYAQLLMRFGSAGTALEALPDLARRGGGRLPKIAETAIINAEIAAVERLGAAYLFLGESTYPPALAQLANAPPVLTWRGNLSLLQRPMVSIVGARNASAAACRFARQLAFDLAGEGVTVVSGLARGIDTAAHIGAIQNGTVAVIASGIDISFPPENGELQEKIAREQLLLAEQPPGTEPLARHFPYRNRIIAGLSAGTIVVEAAPRSGSLITARLAGEYGRDVMAVPGSPLEPRAQGCNGLIRDGAILIRDAGDVLETIRPLDARAVREARPLSLTADSPPHHDADDSDRARVTSLLGNGAVSVDELVRQSRVDVALVQLVLLELELAGRLDRHAGNRVSWKG
ncbi:DNA-protecting protein DprA [Pseudonocardia sp. TMWB2A]